MDVDSPMLRLEALDIDVQLVGVVRDIGKCKRAVNSRGVACLEAGNVIAQLQDHAGQRTAVRTKDLSPDHTRAGGKRADRSDHCQAAYEDCPKSIQKSLHSVCLLA